MASSRARRKRTARRRSIAWRRAFISVGMRTRRSSGDRGFSRSRARVETALHGAKDRGERAGVPLPTLAFGSEMLPTGGGQRVHLGSSSLFRRRPFSVDEPALFETIEGGVQRARIHVQHVLGNRLNAETQLVAVGRFGLEELEHDQVERALQ